MVPDGIRGVSNDPADEVVVTEPYERNLDGKGILTMHAISRRKLLELSAGSLIAGVAANALLPTTARAAALGELPPVPGMLGDRRANEMFYQFDQTTLFEASPELLATYAAISKYIGGSFVRGFRDIWLEMSSSPEYPRNFIDFAKPIETELRFLSRTQLGAFDQFYRPNSIEFIEAFAYFGQGVLFDPRRTGYADEVHTMDGDPPQEYHVWHAYLRAMMFLDIDRARWARFDPVLAFAWAVQSIAKPKKREVNPPLPVETVAKLALHWLPRNPEQLDRDFRSQPYPAGIT